MSQWIAVVLFNLGGPDNPDAIWLFLFNLFATSAIASASRSSFFCAFVWADIFRRHRPDLVAAPGEDPSQMVRTAARFHCDNALWQIPDEGRHSIPPHPTAQNYCTRSVQPTMLHEVLPRSIPGTMIAIGPFLSLQTGSNPIRSLREGRAIP